MVINKVCRTGNSHYIIINRSFLRALELKQGDYVKVWVAGKKILVEKLVST